MGVLIAVFKFLRALWPFFSEMFLADKSLKDVVMANKMVCVLLFALLMSLTMNYFSVSKIFEIAGSRPGEREGPPIARTEGKDSERSGAPPPPPNDAEQRYQDQLRRLREMEQRREENK